MSVPLIETHYDLAGPVLRVRGEDAGLLADLHASLGSLAAAPGPPSFRIDLRRGPVGFPESGDLVFDGDVPVDGRCVMRRTGETLSLVFPGLQSLAIDSREARAEICVAAAAGTANWTIQMLAVDAAIDACGQTLIHAAGLTLPGRPDAILLHAPSGTGKTTAALALSAAGFGLLSDDGMIIGRNGSGWIGWGLPRAVKIHRRTAAMLPLFAAALGPSWDGNGEQALPLARLVALIRVESPAPRRLAGMFQLGRAAERVSAVRPAGLAETLASLAADNVRTGRTGLLPAQKRRMAALASLVASVPQFHLESGDDLGNLGALVIAALGAQDRPA